MSARHHSKCLLHQYFQNLLLDQSMKPQKDALQKIGCGILANFVDLLRDPFMLRENLTDLQILGKTFIKMSTGALETSQHLSSKDKKNFWRG